MQDFGDKVAGAAVNHDDCFVAVEGRLFEVAVVEVTLVEWTAAVLVADGIVNAALEHRAGVVVAEVAETRADEAFAWMS